MRILGGRLKRSPLTIVELLIGIATIAGGIYLLSPALELSTVLNGASPLVTILGSQIGILLFGAVYLGSGLGIVTGIVKHSYKVRYYALFINILVRIYSLLGTLLIQGPLPPTWLPSLCVIAIAIVCYVVVRGMLARGLM